MLDIKRIPIPALIGLVLTALFLLAAIFAPLDRALRQSARSSATSGSRCRRRIGSAPTISAAICLSRMIYGARTTIFIAVLATALSFTLGSILGFTAAVVGGWFDTLMSRFVDLLMAIPTLIFGLVVLSVLPTNLVTLILVMGILDSTRVYRLSRAVAVDINVMDFVEAAKLRGEGSGWIIFREILPNALSPLVSELGLRFIYAVLFLSALSFLGLGVQPPDADWGGMVKENKDGIVFGIAAALIPAAAIASAGDLRQPRRRLGAQPHHQPQGRARLMADQRSDKSGLLLDIRNLRIEATVYPPGEPPKNITLVHDVSLTLERGKVLGLIGESGAGKSTIGLSSMGYGRGGVRITGGEVILNGRDILKGGKEGFRKLRGREVCYVAQSAAAAFNPAHRLMDQVVEASLLHGIADTRRGREARRRAVQEAQPAQPRNHRRALPAPGVRRPVAARDDGDGAVLRAGPDRLRRADHRARRDDADRRAGGDQGRHPRHRTSRRSTSPTTSPSSPRSRTRSWCCATAGWSNGAAPARSSRSRARNTPTRWSRCTRSSTMSRSPARRRSCRSRTSPPPMAAAMSRC